MSKFRQFFSVTLCVMAAGCSAPTNMDTATGTLVSPTPSLPMVSPDVTRSPSPETVVSMEPKVAAPFSATSGARFGEKDLSMPAYAAFDPQQGLVYVADVLDRNVVTLRYQLLKFNIGGNLLSKSSLVTEARPAPTRIDGVVANLAGLPIVNTMDDKHFQLMKVAGVTVSAADRYPVNNLPYARLSASATADNGKHVVVAVVHRSADSNNTGPEYLSLGRSEEDKAPSLLYRIEDPLRSTARLTVGGDGRAFLAGPSREGKLTVVRVNPDRSVEPTPIELPSTPDVMALGPDERLYMAWNSGGRPARVRSVTQGGEWSIEGEVKLLTGEYLTQVSSIAFESTGRSVLSGAGFDAAGRSMKAVFIYSK